MPPGLRAQLRLLAHTLRPLPESLADLGATQRWLEAAWHPEGYSAGFDVRTGWLPPDLDTTARVGDARACAVLIDRARTITHPRTAGLALHALLDHDPDEAGVAIDRLTEQLLATQDLAGTWTLQAGLPRPTSAQALVGAALDRVAQLRGDAQIASAATRALEYCLSQQKTNGYFYGCTWSTVEGANPLLVELLDTVASLLRLGLAREDKHYRLAGLLTLRLLLAKAEPAKLVSGAWTMEWNAERYRSPGGTARLARLCRLALETPAAERGERDWLAEAERLEQLARRAVLSDPALLGPEQVGAVPGSRPLWGREAPWTLATVSAHALLSLESRILPGFLL